MGANFDIIIVGAGIVGLSTSISLADKGHRVTVLERYSALNAIGGMIGLGPQATWVFERYGILDDVLHATGPRTNGSAFHRHWTGKVIAEIPPATIETIFGHPAFPVKRSDVQKALCDIAIARGVTIRFDCKVQNIDQDAPSVTLETGETIMADMIVAADGIRSTVRNILFPGDHQLFSGIDDYLTSLPVEVLLNNPKLARLSEATTFWWGEKGCVVAMAGGTEDNHRYFMEFCHFGNSGEAGNWNKKADMSELREVFKDWDPVLMELLTLVDDARILKVGWTALDLRWVSQSRKVILVGDAGHAMLPHTGSGAGTGIEDSAALAECLARASSKADIGKCLDAFETIRKPRAQYIQQHGINLMNEMHLPDGPEQEARDARLAAIPTRVPPSWDRKHIDDPPTENMLLQRPYIMGHDAVGYTNKMLDKIFSNPPQE